MFSFSTRTKRPRNINAWRGAAILYGDWGTSKAYVLGLAFAIAGYSSFWLILAVTILIALVGINYTVICKYYPMGGGVYASVRNRSEILALVGAFFLIADYLVTAALSALSSFYYLGVPFPELWAVGAILGIGVLNYFGPKHTGSIAFLIVIPTVIIVIILGIFSIPYIPTAIQNIRPLHGDFRQIMNDFVVIIVALSGIEAIANITGVMNLDPGSTPKKPQVTRTATPAILWVMVEVCFFTALFGLVMNALPGLQINGDTVDAPGYPDVRDSMLRYMADVFVSEQLNNPIAGQIFGLIVSIVFCVLLLSAVNTAIVALSSLLFILARDHQMPTIFEKLNGFGVPIYSLAASTIGAVLLIIFVNDVAGLANLYAVGFVGAIMTNLGSTSTDFKLNLKIWERGLMFFTFLIMAVIEFTLIIDKPDARNFAIMILAVGLFLRTLSVELYQRAAKKKALRPPTIIPELVEKPLKEGAMLCAVSTPGKTLEFSLQESKKYKEPLFILFIRQQEVITEEDRNRSWVEDHDACRIFDYAKESSHETELHFLYIVSDSPPNTIVETALEKKVSRLILGMPRRGAIYRFLRGNVVEEVRRILPSSVELIVLC